MRFSEEVGGFVAVYTVIGLNVNLIYVITFFSLNFKVYGRRVLDVVEGVTFSAYEIDSNAVIDYGCVTFVFFKAYEISSSSKNKKANELNIPIITEEEFLEMCGE